MLENKKCNCSRCHSWFDYNELEVVERTIFGVKTKEKHCPKCHAGVGYTAEEHEDWFNKKYE